MTIIGIDLGTTNSLVCTYRNEKLELIPNALGGYITKSAVSFLEGGSILVGEAARERLVAYPENTVASFKSYMGTEHFFSLDGKSFQAQDLSAFVLRQLREDAERYLGESVEEAVISVPAYFNDNQRCATKLAAKLAGLPVSRLINEPSAAALYYQTHKKQDSQLMVIDFGGGTFDVSVVECFDDIIEILSIAGDNRLGGNDIDQTLVNYFCRQHSLVPNLLPPSVLASLYRQAESAKQNCLHAAAVMSCQMDQEYSLTLTPEILRDVCQPLFLRMKQVITRAFQNCRIRPDQLTDVILVGGSSKLDVYVDFLETLFGKRPFLVENPDEIVALGAGLCAAIKSRDLKDVVMTDVCPFSLGIASYNNKTDRNPHMAVMIERSSLLPASHQDRFYTLNDYQAQIRCEIFQGENYHAYENLKLGEISVQIPPGAAGKHYVDVTFTYDIEGILHVEACGSGGDRAHKVILNPKLNLSEEELAAEMQRLEQIKLNAEGAPEDKLLQAKLERLYCELAGEKRDYAARLLASWDEAKLSGDLIERKRVRNVLEKEVQRLEYGLLAEFPIENPFRLLH